MEADQERGGVRALARILWNGLEAVRIVATGLLPFMPEVAPQVLAAVGSPVPPASFDGARMAAARLAWGGTPDLGAAAGAVAAVPAHRQGGLPRRGGAGCGAAPAPAPPAPKAAAPARRLQGGESAMIDIEKFFETELKVGTVTAAEAVPKSNKLVKLAVDLGGETRQVVAGIARRIRPRSWSAARWWWSPTCSRRR